jgi:hypothetical protein
MLEEIWWRHTHPTGLYPVGSVKMIGRGRRASEIVATGCFSVLIRRREVGGPADRPREGKMWDKLNQCPGDRERFPLLACFEARSPKIDCRRH